MRIDSSTSMALGLAGIGGALKIYGKQSTKLTTDQKAQYDNIGNFALYSGLGLALLFHFTK